MPKEFIAWTGLEFKGLLFVQTLLRSILLSKAGKHPTDQNLIHCSFAQGTVLDTLSVAHLFEAVYASLCLESQAESQRAQSWTVPDEQEVSI